MPSKYHIAIVGSGPAGLSAAGRAAHHDRGSGLTTPSYILLEGYEFPSKTIQCYQKGKLVMAEPGFLDLRSDFAFAEGKREEVLSTWDNDLASQGVNIRHGAEVASIRGAKGDFALTLANGETLAAEHVVLAIGLEGNPRKLGVPGDDLPFVEYHLADPDEFKDEVIVVVGAGDSAIENALALWKQNQVVIINRRAEFSRAKEGNLNGVLAAISDPGKRFSCLYSTTLKRVEQGGAAGKRLTLHVETPEGERAIACDRIIGRLGAVPPRDFVEATGVVFPNKRPEALPELSRQYESNIPGLYIIGSLAGFPLIKQAMNQGYDVIEYIHGNDGLKPADHPLLEYQFHGLPFEREVDDLLGLFQKRIPMFRQLNSLAFRELIIESNVIVSYGQGAVYEDAAAKMKALQPTLEARKQLPRVTRLIEEGSYVYRAGEYGTSFFTVLAGEVTLENPDPAIPPTTLKQGQFFGETSLLSGRPRLESALAGADCILVETPRRIMIKLMNSNEEVRRGIDWIFIVRLLQRSFAPSATVQQLGPIADRVKTRQLKAGEKLFEQDKPGTTMHLIRSGAVTLARAAGQAKGSGGAALGITGQNLVIAELRTGELAGEMALMGDPLRRETATAAVATETIEVGRDEFVQLVELGGEYIARILDRVKERQTGNAQMEVRPEAGSLMRFLMGIGLGEATDALVIDESLCIGCDNCEKACAETHGGISRLDRKGGATHANVHVPIACRHCEQPHCMKDCPPNAIHRAPNGQVYIDDTCIGCGNCKENCPYGVIRMEYAAPKKPGLLSWLLFGRGPGPGEVAGFEPDAAAQKRGKKAVKCDACVSIASGPACVSSCPTGAAKRIGPDQFIDLVESRSA